MPRSLGARHVLVNVPAFTAALIDDGRVTARHRTVVGARRTPTPQLSATITAVTINPWWNVPQSIIRDNGGRFGAGYEVRAAPAAAPASASRRGRATRSAGSRSRCRTSTPSICTTRPRSRCSAGRCAPSAMAASAPRTCATSPLCCSRRPASGTARRSTAPSPRAATRRRALAQPVPVYIAYFTAAATTRRQHRHLWRHLRPRRAGPPGAQPRRRRRAAVQQAGGDDRDQSDGTGERRHGFSG